MKHWKRFLTLMLALCALLSFAACGGTPDDPESSNPNPPPITSDEPEDGKTNLVVGIISDTSEREMMESVIAAYEAKNPDVNIRIMQIAGNYSQQIVNLASTGELPDVYMNYDTLVGYLAKSNVSLDLTPYLVDYNISADDFYPSIWQLGVIEDKVYMMPREYAHCVVYYNKEILLAAGVDMSIIKNGWTWNDFLTVCQQVRDYYDGQGDTSYFPIDSNLGWEPVAYSVIRSFGGQVLNEQGEFALTQDTAGEVVDFVQNLVDRKFIPESGEQDSSFESGTGAMLFQSTSLDNYANRAIFQDDSGNPIFDIVSFPLINGQSSSIGMGYAGYALNSHLDDEGADPMKLNLAAAFLSYMMSQDGQQRAAEGGLTLPSIRTDLSYSNPDANWHKEYSSKFNLEAYTWGSDYKTAGLDFLGYTDPVFSSSLISAMDSFVGTYAVRDPENAFTRFREEVQYAFDSVVTA